MGERKIDSFLWGLANRRDTLARVVGMAVVIFSAGVLVGVML